MNIAKRTKRLQELIEKIKAGNDVARRDLKLALTPDEWNAYEASVEEQKNFNEMLLQTPDPLKKYNELLKIADFSYNRAEAMSRKGDPQIRTEMYHRAESGYEAAIQFLTDALQAQPDLQTWLDRNITVDSDNSCSSDRTSVPRLITSTSHHRDSGAVSLTVDKRLIKLSALQQGLEHCKNGTVMKTDNEIQPEYIVQPLSNPMKDKDFSNINFD